MRGHVGAAVLRLAQGLRAGTLGWLEQAMPAGQLVGRQALAGLQPQLHLSLGEAGVVMRAQDGNLRQWLWQAHGRDGAPIAPRAAASAVVITRRLAVDLQPPVACIRHDGNAEPQDRGHRKRAMKFAGHPAPAEHPPIPILAYHQVDHRPGPGRVGRDLVVAPRAFARQMRLLQALGWKGLSMGQLEPYLRGEQHGKVFGITFDDGYSNTCEHALPVLQQLGFSSTIYVVSGQIGGANVWDHPLGYPPARLMTLAQLHDWLGGGQEVGAHTRNHVDLRQCDEAVARAEITGSRRDLEHLLQVPVRHFCYPYGHYRPEHAAMAREAGYASATTTHGGRSRAGADLFELPRVVSLTTPGLWWMLARWKLTRWQPPVSAPPSHPGAAPMHAAPAGSAHPH